MIAAIMCGGRGSRMEPALGEEKLMLKLKGKAMIERVYHALYGSGAFERIVGAVSSNAPATKSLLGKLGAGIIETRGGCYPEDLSILLANLKPSAVLVVPADLPLLSSRIIRGIISSIDKLRNEGMHLSPAISIVATRSFAENVRGITPSVVFEVNGKRYCHSGITVFDTSKITGSSEIEEQYVVMNQKEIVVNVNTRQELRLAEKLLPP